MLRTTTVVTFTLSLLAATLLASHAAAQLNWEGQGGVFLNPIAYAPAAGKIQASSHFIDLDRLGSITTFSVAGGVQGGIEVGFTRIVSGVSGVGHQTVVPVKWQFAKETASLPGAAAAVIYRDINGSGGVFDYGLIGTKVVKVGTSSVLLNLGLRSTKAKGVGLFGVADGARLKWEGSAAIFVTSNVILGAEFKEQIGGRTWTDVALRYIVDKNLNVDLGIANFAPTINNQFAAGVNWQF